MKFSESWLRSWVNPNLSTNQLADVLTMAGLEVEGIEPAAPMFNDVVVGQIVAIEKHPDADRLNVCQVDVGLSNSLQIVCGASNAALGLKVPCARVGAVLPNGLQIKLAKVRGVESSGMLCSAQELGLAEASQGLLVLAEDAPVGESLRTHLDLDDQIFELKLTPNRADCLSMLGVAREVTALTQVPYLRPAFTPVPVVLDEIVPVNILAPTLCGRFAGRVIRGVNARAQTPFWMKTRLERAGLRSISALVDISNYVMLALGRPSHVFDLSSVKEGLEVRWAKAGETLKLLNDQEVMLAEDVGVVASGGVPESMAGIMGGDASAVTLDTTDVYVEAAFWFPEAIRGRARRYKFSSDASHRFERGVDFESIIDDIEYISALIVDICGGQAAQIHDVVANVPKREPVEMRVARARQVIGVDLSVTEIAEIFTRLGFAFTYTDTAFVVTPPAYRFDLAIEADLIEEVVRVYGFERIPASLPIVANSFSPNTESTRSLFSLRQSLAASGYQELINFTFTPNAWEQDFANRAADDPNTLRVLNPIASHLDVMRSTLLGSLLDKLIFNLHRQQTRVRLFEIGRTFSLDQHVEDSIESVAGVNQPLKIAGLAYGFADNEQWGVQSRRVDFFDVKADVERLCVGIPIVFEAASHVALHPGRSARILLAGQEIGYLGELHPALQQKYELPLSPIVFELDATALQHKPLPLLQEIGKFPAVTRDLALVVKQSLPAARLLEVIAELNNAIIRSVAVFDEFKPLNAEVASAKNLALDEKSLALRIVLQDAQQTLQDVVVEEIIALILNALSEQTGARLR